MAESRRPRVGGSKETQRGGAAAWAAEGALEPGGASERAAPPAIDEAPEPSAPRRPSRLAHHDDARVDPWYWLRERESREVRGYLEAENAYLESRLGDRAEVRAELERELAARIADEESSAPYRLAGAWYRTRYVAGSEYELFCRREERPGAAESVLLDANRLARGHAHFQLAPPVPSPSGRYVAFAADTVGRRFYTLRVLDTETGETLADRIEDVTDEVVWANDEATLFYARQDPQTLRSHRVYRHRLGDDVERDDLVFEETDETYWISLARFRSGRYLAIRSGQTLSTEYRVLEADRPEGEFHVVEPRVAGREYELDHLPGEDGGVFLVLTNDGAPEFRLMSAPASSPGRESWRELVPAREGVLLEQAQAFADRIALRERRRGLSRIRLISREGGELRESRFEEPAYVVALDPLAEIDGPLRLVYSSPTTPRTHFEEDLASGARRTLHQAVVAGGFTPDAYRTERVWARARDGSEIPVTLLSSADAERAAPAPLLLVGYGAYGISYEPAFNPNVLSLVDRSFLYAIAHVRGGSELGRSWCEAGRRESKRNTFTDFVDVAEHLVDSGRADRQRLYAAGGSAGGLLIGAVLNLRPDLFHGAIANVPFVDVLTTMLDPSIPLTTGEYDEWGDPREPRAYASIKSYSPYDNVRPADYPNLLVIAGFHDSQVQYWEPAKWVAKLRAVRTDPSKLLLLRTHFEAGHLGATGRYRRLGDVALQYAFLLSLAFPDG
ncbi:MAG: S9 family peptidase [Holophagales bacterium]|nr:S9 family peptidase [Holophagales bacterium]